MILQAYLKNYEENAAYTCVTNTCINAQLSEIVNFTSKLSVGFFNKPWRIFREILNKREVSQENSYTEIRKTYFLAPKLEVDLYTGSTYTRVNMVY